MKLNYGLVVALVTAGLMVGCGESSEQDEPIVVQEDAGDDDAGDEDVEQIGGLDDRDALAELPCGEEMLLDWPLNEEVSQASFEVSEEGGVFTATIDASAGGTQASSGNPFVYLNLESGEQAQI